MTNLPTEAEALCKAALWNTIMMCQGHLGSRSHTTGADVRLFEGLWSLILTNFTKVGHPNSGDYIPQTQEQPDVSPHILALEQVLSVDTSQEN